MSNSRMQNRLPRKALRTALVVALSLSMVLGGVPVPALQAFADEVDDLTPIEEPVVDPTENEGEPEGEGAQGEEGQGEEQGENQPGEGEEQPAEGEEQPAEDEDQPAEGEESDLPAEVVKAPKPAKERNKALKAVKPGNQLNPNNHVTTVDNKDYGIKLNLFDYETNDDQSNHYGSPYTSNGINQGKSSADETTKLFFYAKGDLPGDHSLSAPNINTFAGFGGWSSDANQNGFALQYALQGIVKRDLSGDENTDYSSRYPVINTSSNESLAYLFDPNTPTVDPNAKKSYTNVNHFFEEEDGYLHFSSNEHYAYYDKTQGNNGDFIIYEDTYRRYSGSGASNLAIGFFPFDEFNGGANGQGPSKPGACINPTTSGQWNSNNHVNHTMGMSMTVPITMPYNGQVQHVKEDGTTEMQDMIFEFSGDDDMWVFIDGRLVLDVGGIHQPVKGTINFHTGQVEITSGTTADTGGFDPRHQRTGQYNNQYSYITGNFTMTASGITDTYVLGTTSSIWEDTKTSANQKVAFNDVNRWPADTEHVVQFFYLERGGCDSNLEIKTNVVARNETQASVEKQWDPALYNPAENIDHRQPVDVQLIRQAVMREENTSTHEHTVIGYGVVDHKGKVKTWNGSEWVVAQTDSDNDGTPDTDVTTNDNPITLSNENRTAGQEQWWGWEYTWENLPTGGYNVNGWDDDLTEENFNPSFDPQTGEVQNNVYCDYNYFVREVPSDEQTFVPRYEQVLANDGKSPLYPDAIPIAGETGKYVPALNALYPVRITNKPVTIDVDKIWRNAAGTAADTASHDNDEVYVQLYRDYYKNTAAAGEPEVWEWVTETVDDPVKLSKDNDWKHTYLASPSENMRYYIVEGTMDGGSFVPAATFKAARTTAGDASTGSPYVIDETMYARDGERITGSAEDAVTSQPAEGGKTTTYTYYWKAENEPAAGKENEEYALVRYCGGDAELVQYGGKVQEHKSDTIEITLEVPAGVAEYKAVVDLGDKLKVGEAGTSSDIKVDGDGTVALTTTGFEVTATPSASEKKTITLQVPVAPKSGSDLSAIGSAAPAVVTVKDTLYVPAQEAEKTIVLPSAPVYGSYLQLSDVYIHGTATVANKPIKLLKLRKVDAKAYDEATKKAAAYNEEHPDETPAKTFVDYLAEDDYLKGAEFKLYADDLNGTSSTADVTFDKATDMVDTRLVADASNQTVFTTGDDGTVKLPSLTEKGTYWLIETKAPTGYLNRGVEKRIQITVDENGVVSLAPMTEEAATKPTMQSAKGVDTITVPNVRTYVLPAAGGPGAYPFLIAGAFVAAYAFAGFGGRNRRGARRRGAKSI